MIRQEIPNLLFASPRPGYDQGRNLTVPASVVQEWIATVKSLGLKSIICLLNEQHLGLYQSLTGGLLDAYRKSGFTVRHVPVVDYQWPPLSPEELESVERHFEMLPKPPKYRF